MSFAPKFLQAILNDFEWVMAQAVLAMAFLAEWTTRTTAMDVYTVLPVQTDSYCARGYPICSYTLACLHGYSLDCRTLGCNASETCEDLGSFFRKSDWNGMCDHWEDVENRTECCQCVGFLPPPETVAPSSSFHRCYDSADRCPDSYSGSCCFTRLNCPSGYSLSDPVGICGQTDCGIENYAVSELNYMGSYCHGVFPGDRVLCQTCVKDPGETSTSPALLTLVVTTAGPEEVATSDYTAPTHNSEECDGPCSYVLTCPSGYRLECQGVPCAEETLCSALGDFYQVKSWSNCGPQDEDRYECCRCARAIPSTGAWEMLGRPDKAACRGRTPTDNSPSYYTVHSGIDDLEECKALCLQHFPRCKGIEHSHGRCEIWTRPEGISLGVELNVSGFTCMRFGWAAKHLVPVDGGVGRACRGSTSNDNQPSYYRIMDAETLQACQAMCTAAPLCYGIEFSSGRCEIWVERIGASVPIEGFACFAYDPAAIPVFTEKDILIP